MLKPEQVPHAAVNALLLALRQRRGDKEAIVAAINAWPGMFINKGNGGLPVRVHLPLTQEKPNE